MSTPTEPLTFGQQAALLACEYADEYVTAEAEKAITAALIAAYQRGRAEGAAAERERAANIANDHPRCYRNGVFRGIVVEAIRSLPTAVPLDQSEQPDSRGKAE